MRRKISGLIIFAFFSIFLLGCDPAGQTTTTSISTTAAPTSAASTTVAPTTLEPTTEAPTTIEPTTASPTTVAPTTASPTTAISTTAVPTTATPTTVAPTTAAPTTAAPTTVAPTTTEPITTSLTTEPVTTTSDTSYLFIPGYLGELSLPVIEAAEPNTFAGLFIDYTARDNEVYGGGTYCDVWLSFPSAWELGATTLTLQYYDSASSLWNNYGTGEDYTTDYNNFVLTNPGTIQLRLKANGGEVDGFVSNTVTTAHTIINTYFSSWGLDESMSITGIMTPYVGHGLEAYFNVQTLDTKTPVLGGLTYQWVRINPNTYEHTPISGATELTYITTVEDVGYYIGIIATGDEVTVGGHLEIISYLPVLQPVEMFATDASNTGFDIHFDHFVDGLDLNGFMIFDTEYNSVEVVSITQGETDASYHVTIAAPITNQNLYINYQDSSWIGISYFEEQHMTQQLVINLES